MARGDQIYAIRQFLTIEGVYQHHGIDCGDGTVIHYRKPSATIERTSIATMAQGSKVYVKQYQTCFIPDVAIRRAESRLGEQKYNLLFNNCEHFATWCKTGVSYSQQVVDFIPMLANINIDSLAEPVGRSLKEAKQDDAIQLVDRALSQIRVTWDTIQPQYTQELKEIDVWQRVAIQALKQKREDLARAALQRKREYKQRAESHQEMLQKLAKMTETLLRNQQSWQQVQ
ncbi:lecithin retinol acyltransferase family protein [Aerosakkonema funiforme]|uniref:lecithin retinol acyltransferase family protein n=1 Tax=Aerosakkonema funiforme TaxID=1246630 RepID=UPI0035BB19D3